MNKILLVGVARSGTTWVATILSKCMDTRFLNEPDDERRFVAARQAKAEVTRYPTIAPGDTGMVGEAGIATYADMWRVAWESPGAGENLLIKSVFVPFCLEWLKERFNIDHVVWVRRDPYKVIESWYEYSSQANPNIDRLVLIRRLAWQAASHYAAYNRLAQHDFFRVTVDHAHAAKHPKEVFDELAKKVGLEMGHEAWEQLSDLNSAGVGGHYGLPGYDINDHIRRTTEQALAPPNWSIEENEIIMKELVKWGI